MGCNGLRDSKAFFADPPVSAARAALMASVRQKGSRPEMIVRKLVHRMGYRYRLHRRDLPGSPDLVFPRLKKVVFVHGCFWHRHEGCSRASNPKTRSSFWGDKFARNVERDAQVETALRRAGWRVLVVWECDTFEARRLAANLRGFLRSQYRKR
jgi:DNA mismatch endonuclease, patch repair protein